MDKPLKSLIKQAMEVIQSLLILVPPLVVDCSFHPDIDSGAYPGRKGSGFTSADYVTTQSALFYSYEGESEAKPGEFTPTDSIRKNFLSQFSSSSKSNNEDENLKSSIPLVEQNSPVENHTQRGNVHPEVPRLTKQDEDKNEEEYEHLSLGMFSSSAINKCPSMNKSLSILQRACEVHPKVNKQTQTDIILGTSEVSRQIPQPKHVIATRNIMPSRNLVRGSIEQKRISSQSSMNHNIRNTKFQTMDAACMEQRVTTESEIRLPVIPPMTRGYPLDIRGRNRPVIINQPQKFSGLNILPSILNNMAPGEHATRKQ